MIPFPGLFYWRNKLTSIPLFALVSLSVAIIGVVATLTGSILDSIYNVDVKPYESYSILVSKDLTLDTNVLNSLENMPSVSFYIPFLDSNIRVMGLFGSESRRVYAVSDHMGELLLERLGLQLTEGHLPRAGSNDIVLHQSIMKARGLAIGDYVGQEVDRDDYLWGLFRVCGTITGETPIGIASLDFFKKQWMFDLGEEAFAVMVFPSGDIGSMNESIQSLTYERMSVRYLDSALENYNLEARNMDLLLWIVNLAIVSIISFSMGLLNTIHFLGRMKEYGLLTLIGLHTNQLFWRAFVEVLIMALVGFLGGIAISWLLTWGISNYVFAPRGVSIGIVTWRNLIFTLPIPLFLAAFSFVTIGWNIKRMDVITVIEGRD